MLGRKKNAASGGHGKRNLIIMLSGCLVVASVLLMVSMHLYRASGAEQLDLSRPGYAREDVLNIGVDDEKEFSATGTINRDTVKEFNELYKARMEAIMSVDAFSADTLSDEALGIN